MSVHPSWPLFALAVAGAVWFALGLRGSAGAARRAALRRLGLAVLVVLVALRPVVGGGAGRAMASDIDLVFVVDRTTSMGAQDWNGQARLTGVATDVRSLVESFAGARFALVTFDSGAWVELPWTTDGNALVTATETIVAQTYIYSSGSSISRPVPTVRDLLQAAEQAEPDRRRYVVYLGDGEQTDGAAPGSFEAWRPLVGGGRVLGYGTTAGAKVPTGFGREGSYVYDREAGSEAISRLDEAALQRAAEQIGVPYEHRTAAGEIALRPRGGFSAVLGDTRVAAGFELYWLFALGVLGLGAWELWGAASGVRTLRKELT